jgi:hypothetical protein
MTRRSAGPKRFACKTRRAIAASSSSANATRSERVSAGGLPYSAAMRRSAVSRSSLSWTVSVLSETEIPREAANWTIERAELWLSPLLRLHKLGRCLCAPRQEGRGEDRCGGSPPPQSQPHCEMDDRTHAECAACVRRIAQSWAAGGVNADPALDKLTTVFDASTIESTNGG